jgi:hypothetical protein
MSSKAKQAKVAAMAPQAKQKQAEQAKAAAIDLQAKQTEAKQAKAAAIALQAKQAKAADPNHISERFVASLVKNINEAGIPCILWGNRLLRAHGVPTILGVSVFLELP